MSLHTVDTTSLEFDRAGLPPEIESFSKNLCSILASLKAGSSTVNVIARLRSELASEGPLSLPKLRTRLFRHVMLDLINQGWSIKLTRTKLRLQPGDLAGESLEAAKLRIRAQHLQERDAQLRESSVREFIQQMERRKLTSVGWHSIFSIMRDGAELARGLNEAKAITDSLEREAALQKCVDPYLQVVDNKAVCTQTGLRLNDIWRYFRHTWTNSYRSVPGRSIAFLVRDRSTPNHPVIGIAALGSSVVQQSVRDAWIGWDAKGIASEFCEAPTRAKIRWLRERVAEQIAELYVRDLIRDSKITRASLNKPTDVAIQGLLEESDRAIKQHRLYPDKQQLKESTRDVDWKVTAETSLFRSKRCKQLAILLSIKAIFDDPSLLEISQRELTERMKASRVRKAVGQLFRALKADRVGISMMDITVCGAIAPYNAILGGKLVCSLLCGTEIVKFYRDRYKGQVSVIASAMAGHEIARTPKLVLLCTTSLYGGGSSQYNRVKIPAPVFSGAASDDLRFIELGVSEGFGSFHFSKETIRTADMLLGRLDHGRKVNSIFGEGVNPLMRKMREALTEAGLPSEVLLRHGNRRIVYGVPLADNFREVLIGLTSRPKYFVSGLPPQRVSEAIAGFWRQRWLSMRITNPDVLGEVGRHTLSFPIRHGAVVDLPKPVGEEEEMLSAKLQS